MVRYRPAWLPGDQFSSARLVNPTRFTGKTDRIALGTPIATLLGIERVRRETPLAGGRTSLGLDRTRLLLSDGVGPHSPNSLEPCFIL
jgi:hypothetical protein